MEEFVMRRMRSHGEIVNASFSFVRLHAPMIARSLLKLVMPLLLLMSGIMILIYLSFSNIMSTDVVATESTAVRGFTAGLSVIAFLFVIAVAFALANSVYYAIVKLAIQYGTNYTVLQVRSLVKKIFWPMVGLYILQMIFTSLARWVLQIPLTLLGAGAFSEDVAIEAVFLGATAGVVFQIAAISYFSVAFPTLVVEDGTVYNSLMRSVKLVRGHFWKSLGLQLSMGIIVYCMMAAPITHPVLIYQLLRQLLDPVAMSKWLVESPVVSGTAIAIYSLFLLSAFFFIWILYAVAQSLLYTDLVERREGVGLALRLHRSISPVPEPEPELEPEPSKPTYTVTFGDDAAEASLHKTAADQIAETEQESYEQVESSEAKSDQRPDTDQKQDQSMSSLDDSPHPEAASQPSDSSTTDEAS